MIFNSLIIQNILTLLLVGIALYYTIKGLVISFSKKDKKLNQYCKTTCMSCSVNKLSRK
ncbi:MAG: hypothetical protein ACOCW8_02980 [bacterium]